MSTPTQPRKMPDFVGLSLDQPVNAVRSRCTRANLPTIGLVFLGLLSLALLITVIVQAINSGKSENDSFCLTRGCLSAASHQLRTMNNSPSANPCTDFYQYACGGWEETHPIQSFDVERTVLGDIINRRDADIERLLDAPIVRNDQQGWEWKVKTYYKECRDDYERIFDSGKAMVNIIENSQTINGWFLFDNGAENASQEVLLKNQSTYTQVAHIQGDFGVRAVFSLRTRFDEVDNQIKRLEFYPAGLTLEIGDYLGNDTISQTRRAAYQLFIVEVLKKLCQDAGVADPLVSERMLVVASDVLAMEIAFARILQHAQSSSTEPLSISIQEMKTRYSFDFVELMAHELGDPGVVSGATLVYVTNPAYFQDVFNILSQAELDPLYARMFHNYMRWRLLWTYIEDLSYEYAHIHRQFLEIYYGYALHSTNEAYCTREIVRRFPLAIYRLYTMNSFTYTDNVPLIQSLVNELRSGLTQYINEKATWMVDEATKTIARQKINALMVGIGYASIATDDARLDDYYSNFAVKDISHLENSYEYHRFYRWLLSNSLMKPDQLDHWDLFETRTNRLFDYVAVLNQLFVVAGAMHEPLLSVEWPWPMNVGSLGVLIAEKMFSMMDGPDGRIHLPNGTRVTDWWSQATDQAYKTSRQCITDYYVRDIKTVSYNFNGIPIEVQLAGEPFSPTTLRHIAALRFAYATAIKGEQTSSFRMPGTNMTSEQTFFLAYAQSQCYQRQGLLQVVRTQLGIYDERMALNAALVHMPEFARAFQCVAKENTCF